MSKPYNKLLAEDFLPFLHSVTEGEIRPPAAKTRRYKFKYIFVVPRGVQHLNIRSRFLDMTRNYKCWMLGKDSTIFNYYTDSATLKNLYEQNMTKGTRRSAEVNLAFTDVPVEGSSCTSTKVKVVTAEKPKDFFTRVVGDQASAVEAIEDIYGHMQDAARYNMWDDPSFNIWDDPSEPHSISGTMDFNTGTITFNEKGNKMKSSKFKANYKINISVNERTFTLTDPVKPDDALEVVLALTERVNTLEAQRKELDSLSEVNTGTDNISTNKIGEVLIDEIDEIKEMIEYINDNIENES